MELNLDVFNFPCPPTFPFSNTQFYRQLKKIAVIDCATMQSFQFPFVAPPVQRQQTEEDKVHQHTPVLMLGELVPNAVDACSAAVRIIVTDHRLVSHDAVEPSLWVNDHEDNWYRLANSYNPQYQSMGKRIVEMVRQCGLNKGVILNYKVCKTPGSTDSMNVKQGTDQHNSTSFALLDVLTDFSTQKRKMTMASEDDDAGYYLVEGHLEVSSMLLKVAVKLHNLEILWPKLDQDRLPVFQANKQFMLNDPDPAYQPYVTAVADMLFGSSSVYKKRKRVPHSEEYFTVTDFVLHYESAESQHCAVHAVSTVPSGVAVLRGKLVPGKSCGRKQYSEPALDMVAYVHDYYVDIDFEKGSTKDKGRMVVCTYFVMSPMSNYWFKLSTPRQDYLQQYIEPNSYISQNFNWPGDHPADVWRRITDYEIMRGEDAQHCSVFKVRINRDSKGWMVCGDLVAPDSNDKLQIRMYPVNNSIDYGCNGDVSDENAGLWVQAPEVAAWYKLHRPPAAAYKEISDRDWDLAEAIMSFQHFVVKTGERATQSSITLSTCRDEDCKGLRKFSIYCGLSRVWEMSKRSFDLDFVRANKSPFKDHVGSFVCIHQSKSFVGSIDDSKRGKVCSISLILVIDILTALFILL
ncbi:hypothetical protein EON64_01535 [archaeon]|nr:MAG: hypothetical protein EON64_01535 [archaeon]